MSNEPKKRYGDFKFDELPPLDNVKKGDMLAVLSSFVTGRGFYWGGMLYPVTRVTAKRIEIVGEKVDRETARRIGPWARSGWMFPTPEMLAFKKAVEEAAVAKKAAEEQFNAREDVQLARQIHALSIQDLIQRMTIGEMKRVLGAGSDTSAATAPER